MWEDTQYNVYSKPVHLSWQEPERREYYFDPVTFDVGQEPSLDDVIALSEARFYGAAVQLFHDYWNDPLLPTDLARPESQPENYA